MGILMILVFWPLNWLLPGLRTHILFFPLWLGYCLLVDGIVFFRKNTSLLNRNPRRYILLFFFSAPVWWLFELFNWRTQNWFYEGREWFSDVQYAVLATLAFSTVVPAVFGTAELIGSFAWVRRLGKRIPETAFRFPGKIYFFLGILFLALLLIWPGYFFGLIWVSVFFMIDPVNYRTHKRSLLHQLHTGEWRYVVSLAVGCLLCGFFWEMWNFYSYPKWIYHVPFVGVFHVFEMPLPGYLGYIPFALELYALYHLVVSRDDDYVQIVSS